MTGWNDVALGDVVTLINGDRGRNYPSAKHRSTQGIPFVNAGLLVDGRVRPGGDNFISQERFELLRSGHVEVDDVLLCIRGSIGRVAVATADVVPSAVASSVVILRASPAVNPSFLHALLRSPAGQLKILEANNGAAQPNLGAGEVARFRFAIPSRATQDCIAEVLGSIDELIENNRRRVEVLEEMARAIYREWFVHFRYPGHEDVPLVDSPLGPIPKGWRQETLGDLSAKLVDGDWVESKDQGGSDYRLLQVSNIGVGCFRETGKPRYVTSETFDRLRCTSIKTGDILISRMPDPIGRAWLVDDLAEPAITAVDVAILSPRSNAIGTYLSQVLNSAEHLTWADTVATGTTRKRITRSVLSQEPVLLPNDGVLERYHAETAAMRSMIRGLRGSANTLAATRDLLLPKLVTGNIDVSSLDLDAVLVQGVS